MTAEKKNTIQEMTRLIDDISAQAELFRGKEAIPEKEQETIVSKIKELHDKAVILEYLNNRIIEPKDEITDVQADTSTEEPQKIHLDALEKDFKSLDIKKNEDIPVNEKIAPDSESVADKLKQQPVSDLSSAIGVNERFLFTNELFGGDSVIYNDAVTYLNSLKSIVEANSYIESNFHRKYNWDIGSDAVIAFMELLNKRFT